MENDQFDLYGEDESLAAGDDLYGTVYDTNEPSAADSGGAGSGTNDPASGYSNGMSGGGGVTGDEELVDFEWTTDEELRLIASDAGVGDQLGTKDVVFQEHKINGKSRGLVYMEFRSPAAAKTVKDLMDKMEIHGKRPIAILIEPVDRPHLFKQLPAPMTGQGLESTAADRQGGATGGSAGGGGGGGGRTGGPMRHHGGGQRHRAAPYQNPRGNMMGGGGYQQQGMQTQGGMQRGGVMNVGATIGMMGGNQMSPMMGAGGMGGGGVGGRSMITMGNTTQIPSFGMGGYGGQTGGMGNMGNMGGGGMGRMGGAMGGGMGGGMGGMGGMGGGMGSGMGQMSTGDFFPDQMGGSTGERGGNAMYE
ncbi:hypothetical protein HDU67_009508, partial [Dinochytrium kinnereticum]